MKAVFLLAVRRSKLKFQESPSTCSITSEHEHYFVQPQGDEMIYYNECCCSTAMGGVVVDQGIARGPIVICGPKTASNASRRHGFGGGGWTNDAYSAFPSTVATIDLDKTDQNVTVRREDLATFGSKQGIKCQQFTTPHQSRSQHLTRTEEKLGYMQSQWPEPITLDPYIVYMSALL